MSGVFGSDYAAIYDALYRAKDYPGEADLIERLLARHGRAGPLSIVDAGCGTGNHALLLVQRGHEVIGIDRSRDMLSRAREKAARLSRPPRFAEGDIRDFDLGTSADAVLMMFTVLGYLGDQTEVEAAFKSAQRHLAPGGLFIFDVWNGLAVLAQGPQARTLSLEADGGRIVRKTAARLDRKNQIVHVHFDIESVERAGAIRRWAEDHAVRYFFPEELEATIQRCSLRLLDLRRFPDAEAPPDENAWNIIGVAAAA